MTRTTTFEHAIRVWLEERFDPPWNAWLRPETFPILVHHAERAGFRFTSRTRLEQTLRRLLREG